MNRKERSREWGEEDICRKREQRERAKCTCEALPESAETRQALNETRDQAHQRANTLRTIHQHRHQHQPSGNICCGAGDGMRCKREKAHRRHASSEWEVQKDMSRGSEQPPTAR